MRSGGPHCRRRSRGLAIAISLAIVHGAGPTFGKVGPHEASRPTAASLELVTAGCGTLEDLSNRVGQRSSQIRLTDSTEEGPALRAEIRTVGEGRKEIILTVVKGSGQRLSRRMQAQDCDEALEALSLLIVLTLDPAANTTPRTTKKTVPTSRGRSTAIPTSTPAKGTAPTSGSGSAATATPTSTPEKAKPPAGNRTVADRTERTTTPQVQAQPRVLPPPAIPSPPPAPLSRPLPDVTVPKARDESTVGQDSTVSRDNPSAGGAKGRSIFAVAAGGIAIGGPAPEVMLGGSLYALWGWDRNSPWSPAVAVAVGHAETNGYVVTGQLGTSDFALDAVQLEICPVWFGLRRRLGARACGFGIVGRLTARGSPSVGTGAQLSRGFAFFGGSAALILQLPWRVELVATGGLGFPLQRYAYQLDPDPMPFAHVAPVSLMGGVGLGFRFH